MCIDFHYLVILVVTNFVGLHSLHNERRCNKISMYNKLFSRYPEIRCIVRVNRGVFRKIFHNAHLVLYIKLLRVKTFEEIFPTCKFQYCLLKHIDRCIYFHRPFVTHNCLFVWDTTQVERTAQDLTVRRAEK